MTCDFILAWKLKLIDDSIMEKDGPHRIYQHQAIGVFRDDNAIPVLLLLLPSIGTRTLRSRRAMAVASRPPSTHAPDHTRVQAPSLALQPVDLPVHTCRNRTEDINDHSPKCHEQKK